MRSILKLSLALFMAGSVDFAYAQFGGFQGSAPRTSIGIEAATFRVSYEQFDDFFDSKWGFAWGGHATVRLSSKYNVVVKYRSFDKSELVQFNDVSQSLDWEEQWVNVGVRYIRTPNRGVMNFFGFGLSFFNLEGTGVTRILPATEGTADGKVNSTGFFLDFGIGYPLFRKTYFLIEVELTSVGIDGSGGFESSSIGGIYLGAGLNVFPF
ncbi:MAG: hypothetical protein ACE5I1_22300 [bacterium]